MLWCNLPMDTSAADGGPPRAHSHPRLMRRCLHIFVVVRMPPPHFSPHAAPLPLTPPFRLPPPPLSNHCPFLFLNPLCARVPSLGMSFPRMVCVVPHSPRLHACSLYPLVFSLSAPSAPSYQGPFVAARPWYFRIDGHVPAGGAKRLSP